MFDNKFGRSDKMRRRRKLVVETANNTNESSMTREQSTTNRTRKEMKQQINEQHQISKHKRNINMMSRHHLKHNIMSTPPLNVITKLVAQQTTRLRTSCLVASVILFNYIIIINTLTTPLLAIDALHMTQQTNANISATKQNHQQILASFNTPSQAINITHITYDPLHDTVYLGATNALYQLDGADLSLHVEQSTGPVYDNPSCGISECHGFEDLMKPTPNVNKVLVIDYQHKKLLSCGSTKQGACRRYQLNNIAEKEDLIPMAVAANDDNSSTYAFIAPARYTFDPATSFSASVASKTDLEKQRQQQVLYVASTYTKIGQSRELLVPAIGTRTLDDGSNLLKLYENSFLDSARIDINSHLRDYFLVNYLYGFASSNYIYFVTVQKKATSRDFEELGYHTRLARICITDSSYNSYTEVDLKCTPNRQKSNMQSRASTVTSKLTSFFGSSSQQQHQSVANQPDDYPLLQDAILVDAGSHLLQSLAQNDQLSLGSNFFAASGSSPDDNKVLLGVFSSAKDHTQHAGDHSALCAFSLAQIEDKFNDNIHSCYTGKMQSRNMEYIAGNVQECPKSGQGGNVVNFCHETLKINGTIPIVSEAALQFNNTTLTAITATSYINSPVKNIYSEQLASEQAIDLASYTPASSTSSKKESPASLNMNNAAASRQHTVAFLGTSNGHIKKVLLNNATNGIEFEDIQVDLEESILSDLHLHSSGEQLIVGTAHKVMKIPTHNCAKHTTCRECSQSRNPYCGWCLLKKSCTTRAECMPPQQQSQDLFGTNSAANEQQQRNIASTTAGKSLHQQLKWISTESSAKCIDLQSIVPDKIPMTSAGKVDLYIDRLPRLSKEHQYKCVFNRQEQTSAALQPFGLSCPLPKLIDRQRTIRIEPGRDHALVELAIRSSETNTDFLDGKITFFDCQRHTTCKDCLTTNWGCNWCLNENVCLFNTSKCERMSSSSSANNNNNALVQLLPSQPTSRSGGTIILNNGGSSGATSNQQQQQATARRNSNTISQVQQCPTFDVGNQQDILIADGSEKELSIRVKNMPQFKGAMKCIVEIENYEISLKARVQNERVICENSTYSYAADVGLLNGQLKVIYSDNNIFIDRTNFTLYKCHLLGAYLNRPDCSLCKRIDSRFQCAWCAGSCQARKTCHAELSADLDVSCPAPRIDIVHPLAGPTLGGTRLTIEGSNLGQSFEEIVGRVTVGNLPCKPLEHEYKPSNRIVCVTSAIATNTNNRQILSSSDSSSSSVVSADIVVGNRAGYSIGPHKFHFKSVQLRDHQPRWGPQSGGTRLVLNGSNLNVGSSVQVFLDELPCLVELNTITSEQLVCRTSASRESSRSIKRLKLIVDDAQIIRDDDDVYYYTADPIVSKISPQRAYFSGGRPINVFGANLTVVQAPRMAIHDLTTGRKVNESLCILQDDTRMQCPSPQLNLALMDLEYNEQQQQQQQRQVITTTGILHHQSHQLDDGVKFKLSFIMDNAPLTSYPQLQAEIVYTSDPKLYQFSSAQYKSALDMDDASLGARGEPTSQLQQNNYQVEADTFLLQPGEPQLVLYGEHLRTAVSEYEITVTVGQDLCNLTQLTHTKLVCLVPLDHMATPTDEDAHTTARALPLVVVRIGFNLRYELGYVQYHPQLVEQIVALMANSSLLSSPSLPVDEQRNQQQQFQAFNAHYHHNQHMNNHHMQRRLMHAPAYPQYMPRESESALHKIIGFIGSLLVVLVYVSLSLVAFVSISAGLLAGARLRHKLTASHKLRVTRAKVDALERSLRNECRVASLALQGDLSELVRHVDLSGVPMLKWKLYVMKVFFPGMSNHPLLSRGVLNNGAEQQHNHRTTSLAADVPLEHFERLLMTKQFLISFVNTLERQASFTLRDKVNVASLLMIVLMHKLDYATDVLKTLLLQLVERSVSQLNGGDLYEPQQLRKRQQRELSARSKLARRATNLLNGLPIGKRLLTRQPASKSSAFNKMIGGGGGSASSLMQSTSVAAQMLLARVGHKTSPLQQTCLNNNTQEDDQQQQQQARACNYHVNANISTLDCGTIGAFAQQQQHLDYMSTTTFNMSTNHNEHQLANTARRPVVACRLSSTSLSSSFSLNAGGKTSTTRGTRKRSCGKAKACSRTRQAQLMLRRTDSIVEKMLTNWLALNMYEHLHGPAGRALYMLFEALKCQLERGPVDAISGDAFYSLNEQKLLRDQHVHFEVVSLYVIIDTDVLRPPTSGLAQQQQNSPNLLLADSVNTHHRQQHYDMHMHESTIQRQYPTNGSTITLALRVLDCDTISQVKGKILSALYRNWPHSGRLSADDVELSLRQHEAVGHQQTLSINQQQQQCIALVLQDDDYSSVSLLNGSKRLNTLRHYGVTDQAIMTLKRTIAKQRTAMRTNLADMLDDEHYSNPYTEIQYGHCGVSNDSRPGGVAASAQKQNNNNNKWHLIKSGEQRTSAHLTDDSSSPSSPSMMLLANHHNQLADNNQRVIASNQKQQQFYHPSSSSTSSSSSSTSSTGNVMDTNSTSANSSSMLPHAPTSRLMQNLNHNTTPMVTRSMQMFDPHHMQQPIYCQIGSVSAQSQHNGPAYYCQVAANNSQQQLHLNNNNNNLSSVSHTLDTNNQTRQQARVAEQDNDVCLARMLASKGTVQSYVDDFFKTILNTTALDTNTQQQQRFYEDVPYNSVMTDNARDTMGDGRSGLLAVKWIFDLLDEAALRNGISDPNVVHAWKSNAFLLRFWVNLVKNPNYILDVDKSQTMDASLSVIAQTLMDSCAAPNMQENSLNDCDNHRLVFLKDLPKYKDLVKRFYQDIASMRPVSDQEMVKQMNLISLFNDNSTMNNNNGAEKFDTNLALKELCVYAVNYSVELMDTLNNDYACQQLDLSQQLEQCFRSFTIFEAYQ